MKSDTTGKRYDKLSAFIQKSPGAEIFYLCSSCQYKNERNFHQSIKERYGLAEGARIIIIKAEVY